MTYSAIAEKRFDVVTRQGDEFLCRCPFHNDGHKPNLYVNVRKGVFLCFSCGAKGSLKSSGLVQADLESLRERIEAVRRDKGPDHVRVLPDSYLAQFRFPCDYWMKVRGFTPWIIDEFQLGYDPVSKRAVIPLRDSRNQLLGVMYRTLDGSYPRYVYPKGFRMGRYLFGAYRARGHESVALVEGPLDAVACWDAGVPALALMGSRMTFDQARMVRSLGVRSVVIMTDNDSAGRQAVKQIHDMLAGMPIKVGLYRPLWTCKDPGELSYMRRKMMFHQSIPWHQWTAMA